MAHYGDPAAHRCVLEEVASRPNAPRLMAYLRAAVMGSQGCDLGLQQLRHLPGAVEQPGPLLKLPLALLSLTLLSSAARSAFRKEQAQVLEVLAGEREMLRRQAEQLPTNLTTIRSSSHGCAAPLATASMPSDDGGEIEPALTPAQRWTQSMDILSYCEVYANYLDGFTMLWYELFGPHYYPIECGGEEDVDSAAEGYGYDDTQPSSLNAPLSRRRFGESDGGEGAGAIPASPVGGSTSSHAHDRPPQVPPHLYAVRWAEILTPPRRAWCQGLHNVVKELLVRVLSRELPVELYVLFIQYANLSLRVYLLQTLAEVFTWTAHYVDVLYYVHVSRQSYGVQCEVSQLQRIWGSFGLVDARFIDDCRAFNKQYTESQGAFSEQKAEVAGGKAVLGSVTRSLPPLATVSSMTSAEAVPLMLHASPSSVDGVSSDDVVSGVSRLFPSRAAMNAAEAVSAAIAGINTTTTAAANDTVVSSVSSNAEEDEALSSASDAGDDGGTGDDARAVYLPLFYTCCCFTWILQRTFWSMYGRSSLLLGGCLGSEATPQALRVEGPGRRGTEGQHGAARKTEMSAAGAAATASVSQLLLPFAPPTAARRRGPAGSALAKTSGGAGGRPGLTQATNAARPGSGRTAVLANRSRSSSITRGNPLPKTSNEKDTLRAKTPPPPTPQSPDGSSGDPQGTPLRERDVAAAVDVISIATSPSSTVVATVGAHTSGMQGTKRGVRTGPSATSAPPLVPLQLTVMQTPVCTTESTPSWGSMLRGFVSRRLSRASTHTVSDTSNTSGTPDNARSRNSRNSVSAVTRAASPGCVMVTSSAVGISQSTPLSDAPLSAVVSWSWRTAAAELDTSTITSSGAPFYLQYPHRRKELQLYADPSTAFPIPSSGAAADKSTDAFFFEEFHFLRETGCYVLSHALRTLTCYPRFPVTLLLLSDNSTRPGRVCWSENKLVLFPSPAGDGREEREGLSAWVLNAVIPHTRLSGDAAVRAVQERQLLRHIAFQVAGRRVSRAHFCTADAVFFVLNAGAEVDGGRLYYALHLHVPETISRGDVAVVREVMEAERTWAFRELAELQCGWAMSCTCNEALRVAFQIAPAAA